MHGIFFSVWFVYFQEEQQQLGLQFLIKRVWVAFLNQTLNHLQVGTLLDNFRHY